MKWTMLERLVALRRYLWLALSLCLIGPSHENFPKSGCPTPCTCNTARMDGGPTIVYLYCSHRDIGQHLPYFHNLTQWKVKFTVDKISLDQNYIRTLPPKLFKGLRIRAISFESNPLSFIHSDTFAGTTGITDLNFNECNLTSVPNIFKHTPDIQTLELRGNKIQQITRGIFEPITNLRWIDIAQNQVENLDFIVDRCSFRKAFTSVVLSGNPLNCTCDAYELVKSKTVQLIDGVCSSPRLFQGMYIGTGTALYDDEDDRDTFSVYASRTCNDECASRVLFDCSHSVWTDGVSVNCQSRPVCVNETLECPQGTTAEIIGTTDPTNDTQSPNEDDEDEVEDIFSANGTRIKKRPPYLIEKMRFQHKGKSQASKDFCSIHIYYTLLSVITSLLSSFLRYEDF